MSTFRGSVGLIGELMWKYAKKSNFKLPALFINYDWGTLINCSFFINSDVFLNFLKVTFCGFKLFWGLGKKKIHHIFITRLWSRDIPNILLCRLRCQILTIGCPILIIECLIFHEILCFQKHRMIKSAQNYRCINFASQSDLR